MRRDERRRGVLGRKGGQVRLYLSGSDFADSNRLTPALAADGKAIAAALGGSRLTPAGATGGLAEKADAEDKIANLDLTSCATSNKGCDPCQEEWKLPDASGKRFSITTEKKKFVGNPFGRNDEAEHEDNVVVNAKIRADDHKINVTGDTTKPNPSTKAQLWASYTGVPIALQRFRGKDVAGHVIHSDWGGTNDMPANMSEEKFQGAAKYLNFVPLNAGFNSSGGYNKMEKKFVELVAKYKHVCASITFHYGEEKLAARPKAVDWVFWYNDGSGEWVKEEFLGLQNLGTAQAGAGYYQPSGG